MRIARLNRHHTLVELELSEIKEYDNSNSLFELPDDIMPMIENSERLYRNGQRLTIDVDYKIHEKHTFKKCIWLLRILGTAPRKRETIIFEFHQDI